MDTASIPLYQKIFEPPLPEPRSALKEHAERHAKVLNLNFSERMLHELAVSVYELAHAFNCPPLNLMHAYCSKLADRVKTIPHNYMICLGTQLMKLLEESTNSDSQDSLTPFRAIPLHSEHMDWATYVANGLDGRPGPSGMR